MHASFHPVVDAACRAAAAAAPRLTPPSVRANLLRSLADRLDDARPIILATASRESHITVPELEPEFDRCAATLRLFADLALDSSWRRPTIDPPALPPAASIGPNHDLRSLLMPLGTVAVFGASNFPLAYGTLGGDTASALAAACPVIVKEHPAHPDTGRLFASFAADALAELSLPAALLAYLPDPDPEDHTLARALVTHPSIRAVGFTGSHAAGMALDALARSRPDPIPVFAEMGSTNLIVISRDALASRPLNIADQLAASISARAGQQCTNAGIILLDIPSSRVAPDAHSPLEPTLDHSSPAGRVIARLVDRLAEAPPRLMLSPRVRSSCAARLDALRAHPNVRFLLDPDANPLRSASTPASINPISPTLAFVDPAALRSADPVLWDEIFGPVCLITALDLSAPASLADLLAVAASSDPSDPARSPRGVLTASLYLDSPSDPIAAHAPTTLARVAGRVIFSGVPTGVRVCHSTVHAGPFPATNQPCFSAVGPRAIERWCRPVCFQNCPDALLPVELRDANPLAILRIVAGVLTRDPLPPLTAGSRT